MRHVCVAIRRAAPKRQATVQIKLHRVSGIEQRDIKRLFNKDKAGVQMSVLNKGNRQQIKAR
jgi:hypothetical protein